jgi:ABC-2 type transport system permease protein
MADQVTSSRPLFTWALAQQRRSLIAWSIAVAAASLLYIGFWPSMDGMDVDSMIDSLPDGFVDALGYDQIGTGAGYLSTTVYGLFGPILLMVFGTMKGSTFIAGDEEAGTLELELTGPVPRRRLYLGRLGALWTLLTVLAAIIAALSAALSTPLDMGIDIGNLMAASLGLLLLAGLVGTVAVAAGALTGRRAIAAGAGAVVAVGSFMLDAIGSASGASWMTAISPFSWYSGEDPIQNGADVAGLLQLCALAVVVAVAGAVAYDRRDLMT